MPIYMLHTRGSEPETGDAYPTREDAVVRLQTDRLSSTHKISVVPTPEEDVEWREREENRFHDGTYLRVPFGTAKPARYLRDFAGERVKHPVTAFWITLPPRTYYTDHYVHLSLKHPGMLAYTKSIEHGLADRQTIIRPGSYLDQFYNDVYDTVERAEFATQIGALGSGLKIATSADDIERVYRGGPGSCMAHATGNYSGDEHPTRVYGDSDLAVAYYGDIAHASARAVVWPKKKIHSRIYGGVSGLQALLESAGYREDSLAGARVRAISYGSNNWIMPYVDGLSSATLSSCGDWFVLGDKHQRRGGVTVSTSNTNGLGNNDEDEDEELYTFYCEGCGENRPDDDYGAELNGRVYCSDCYAQRTPRCDECRNRFSQDAIRELDGNDYCERCYSNLAAMCQVCEEDFIDQSCTATERADRSKRGVSDLCLYCSDTHNYCSACEAYYDRPTAPANCTANDGAQHMRIDYRAAEDILADQRATPPEPRYHAHCAECLRRIVPKDQHVLRMFTEDEASCVMAFDSRLLVSEMA